MTYSAPVDVIAALALAGGEYLNIGSYTGNGGAQSIACGFQPRAIFVFLGNSSNATQGGIKTSSMVSNNAVRWAPQDTTTGITISTTGFDVDSSNQFNMSTKTYYYVALK